MVEILTSRMRAAGNAREHRISDLRFARRIRKFRPDRVQYVSDAQLAEIVRRSRQAARDLGIVDNLLVARFVMVDAILAPNFHEAEDLKRHFAQASGTPDVKISDVFQLLKVTLYKHGRGDEVWW